MKEKKKKKEKNWYGNSNRLLSLSAILISAVTLFILIYQTRLASKQFDLEQRQQLASVMPYLLIATGYSNSEEFSVIIENLGIGPAFVKNVRMHYKGEVYEDTDYPLMYERLRGMEDYQGQMGMYSNIMKGAVIPAGRELHHMQIFKGKRPTIHDDIIRKDSVQIEIEYASIYDERWVVKGLHSEPVMIKGLD